MTFLDSINGRKYSKLIGVVGAALSATAVAVATLDPEAIVVAVTAWIGVWGVWAARNAPSVET